MTRLEAAAFVEALDVAMSGVATTPDVIDALDSYLVWWMEAPLATDTRTLGRNAARERLISRLADEEPTQPLAGMAVQEHGIYGVCTPHWIDTGEAVDANQLRKGIAVCDSCATAHDKRAGLK